MTISDDWKDAFTGDGDETRERLTGATAVSHMSETKGECDCVLDIVSCVDDWLLNLSISSEVGFARTSVAIKTGDGAM